MKLLNFKFFSTSPQRTAQVVREIASGSEPGARFYFLVGVSTLIASLGLIANSPAVVIGAMLVAPLMTPIFGISLALVRGDAALLRNAILAECTGIFISILSALLLGSLPLALEVTPEMLARTKPNLFDLLVAILAGSAGAYAMVDESISPALPGVAIATAIVPPLANTGLCIALDAYHGAIGSFLLFVANFLSILIVSSTIFVMAGMNYRFDPSDKKQFLRKFGLAAAGFVAVSIILTHSLLKIVEERNLSQTIHDVLNRELSSKYAAELDKFVHDRENEKLYILASVSGPAYFVPQEIKKMEDALAGELKEPVELIVRNTIVKDMSSTGSTSLVELENLDGFFLGGKMSRKERIVWETEQLMWETIAEDPGTRLQNVDFVMLPAGPVLMVSIIGHGPSLEEVFQVQQTLRERFEMPDLYLLIETVEPKLSSSDGNLLFGWSHYGETHLQEKEKRIRAIKEEVQEAFSEISDLFAGEVYFNFQDDPDPLQILIEVGGGRHPTPKDLEIIQKRIDKVDTLPQEVFLWVKPDTLLTNRGFVPLAPVLRQNIEKLEKEIKNKWNRNGAG